MTSIQAVTPDDLSYLGVEKTGHRKKLLSEIARLSFADRLPEIRPVGLTSFFTDVLLIPFNGRSFRNTFHYFHNSVTLVRG